MVNTDTLQRKRVRLLLYMFTLVIMLLLVFRVGYWQIVKADWLEELAKEQWVRELPIEAKRGDILDTNGNALALSISCYSVVLLPNSLDKEQVYDTDKDKMIDTEVVSHDIIKNLARILGKSEDAVLKVASKKASQVWLERQITTEQADAIRELDMNGVSLTEDKKRYYPLGNFLTQVLGFTSVDGEGLEGIESRFDKYLQGIQGKISVEADRDGNKISETSEGYVESVDGNTLTLTIDTAIQSFAEKALDLCILEQEALQATCIVMDPNTGEILAMVNKPDYDNNKPPRDDIDILRALTKNRAITDVYEPGSTFKIITTASAIEAGEVDLGTHFNCNGYRIIDGQKIKCWATKPHGTLNLTGAVQNSCNPAFMDMAMMMGATTFYDFIYDFGFGNQTGIKMYGESSGLITSQKYIKNVDLARIGFGQAIAMTPLQLTNAVCAVVNGGQLMQPYIIKSIQTPEGVILEEFNSKVIREVISKDTSTMMRSILLATVDNGSGRNAKIEGYQIGGKTGTAQKYGENGQVMHDKHISSFVGIAPMNNPQLVVLVTVDEPSAGSSYGSIVAAPYVKMILEDALPYLNIMKDDNVSQIPTKIVPTVIGLSSIEAKDKLEDAGFNCIIEGYDGLVISQIPKEKSNLEQGNTVIVQMENINDVGIGDRVELPEFLGLSPSEANKALLELGLSMKIMSSGNTVSAQYPNAGSMVYIGSQVALTFEYIEPVQEDAEE